MEVIGCDRRPFYFHELSVPVVSVRVLEQRLLRQADRASRKSAGRHGAQPHFQWEEDSTPGLGELTPDAGLRSGFESTGLYCFGSGLARLIVLSCSFG